MPFPVEYRHEYRERALSFPGSTPYGSLIDGYDAGAVETDGVFPVHGGETVAETPEGEAVIIAKEIGEGAVVVVTTPNTVGKIMGAFCTAERESLFSRRKMLCTTRKIG